nr:MAG TPA: hypothetical protein [Caudoviricetes sp.]
MLTSSLIPTSCLLSLNLSLLYHALYSLSSTFLIFF